MYTRRYRLFGVMAVLAMSWKADMQRRLFAPTTKFIVVARDDPPDWLRQGLAENYKLAETIAGRKVYQRVDHD
jgi:hypothetical protein